MKTKFDGALRRAMAIAVVCAAGILLASTWHVAVANPAMRAAPSTSIAVIDLERVINGLREKEELEQRFQAEIAQRQAELDEISKRLQEVDRELEMIGTGNQSLLRRKLWEKRELETTGRVRRDMIREAIDEQHGELMRGMIIKAFDAAKRVAERDGWDVIMIDDREMTAVPEAGRITSEQLIQVLMTRQVIYANPRVDITDQIVTLMNNEYKAGR